MEKEDRRHDFYSMKDEMKYIIATNDLNILNSITKKEYFYCLLGI